MTMREKIARAMVGTHATLLEWEQIDPVIRGYWTRLADAALGAMAEPTEAMIRAGEDAWADGETTDIYRAMIGAGGNE